MRGSQAVLSRFFAPASQPVLAVPAVFPRPSAIREASDDDNDDNDDNDDDVVQLDDDAASVDADVANVGCDNDADDRSSITRRALHELRTVGLLKAPASAASIACVVNPS